MMDKDKISMRLWVIWCIHTMVQTAVDGRNSFIFTSPSIVRPGRDFLIQGQLLVTPESPVTINAELRNSVGNISSARVTANTKQEVHLNLPVPVQITQGSGSRKFKLKLSSTGGLAFSKTRTVTFEPKSASLFIQTDKAVYKPGQTVNFRVFGVSPDLKVVFDKLKVEIYDANGNKIKQWDVSDSEMTTLGGVFVQHQNMSEAPVLGKWKIKAKLLSHGDAFEEQTFEVDEYVLPKFKTELYLPSFGRTDVPEFKGKIKAKYTFGKPVKGIADLRIRPKTERFKWINNTRQRVSKIIEMRMPINGETEFTFSLEKLKEIQIFLSGSSLIFEANVTEDLTKYKQGDEQELSFYDQPIKLTFPKSFPATFKPGMTYDAVVIVSQRDDTPPDTINGKLKVTVTEYRRNELAVLGDSIPVMIQGHRWWINIPREISNELPSTFHKIPADGIVVFPIDADRRVTKLTIKAEYRNASTIQMLKTRHSPSDTYLQMRLLTDKPQAGGIVNVDIRSTERPGTLNYQARIGISVPRAAAHIRPEGTCLLGDNEAYRVTAYGQIYSRGSIVESGTIPMSSLRKTWSFTATSTMAPKAKIVLFFVRSGGEVIADALIVNVNGVFENQVDVRFNTTSAAPADKIRLEITADAGSDVYVLGVDKSVLLMATGNDITQSQVPGLP